jgi:hypothetical protein
MRMFGWPFVPCNCELGSHEDIGDDETGKVGELFAPRLHGDASHFCHSSQHFLTCLGQSHNSVEPSGSIPQRHKETPRHSNLG